ncbi:unnamed protein product [Closterium sp. Yama58-4]|nr:unnamed protein product [Closterium sp. Yama58-4]
MEGIEKKSKFPEHPIYKHYYFFSDPKKKGEQVECLFCHKKFSFSSSRTPEHLAEWHDPHRRREAGVVCNKVPKEISSEICEMFEAKIRARNQKARATSAAIAAVSSTSEAGGKGKRGRMEDFYGEGGLAARRAADEAIVLYLAGTRTSEAQCEHPLFLNMLRAVTAAGSGYVPPKRHYVGGAGLLKCKQKIEKALSPVTKSWTETGVTIASDMMQDKSGRAQMNVICINDTGAVFVEAVDCKAVTKSGKFIASVLRPIIERIGAEHVVALCTDGGSNYKKAGKLLQKEWPHLDLVPCATHVMDLLMEDVGKMDWAQVVVTQADNMINFVRGHQWTRAFLRDPKLHGEKKSLQVLRPAGTRFGTQFIAVSRLRAVCQQLTAMVTHKDWPEKGGSKVTGADFEGWVMDQGWWKKVDMFLSVMELFYNVMRRTDSAAKGMMGQLYDIMLQLTEELDKLLKGKECKLTKADKDKVREYLRKRWDESLACPLHVAGRILYPANQEEGIFLQDGECTKVMQEWLERQKAFVEKYWKKSGGKKGQVKPLHEGVTAFINGHGGFGTQTAIEGRGDIQLGKGNVMLWWQYNGWEYAHLARIARRTLSQPVSASPCERGWSTWDGVHTARRNRLGSEKVRDLVYVAHNWNVVHTFHKDAEAGPSVVGRKGAVVEGNIPPPPLPEGYKLEEDGEMEADEDDVCLDEWQTQEELEKEGEGEEEEEEEDEEEEEEDDS